MQARRMGVDQQHVQAELRHQAAQPVGEPLGVVPLAQHARYLAGFDAGGIRKDLPHRGRLGLRWRDVARRVCRCCVRATGSRSATRDTSSPARPNRTWIPGDWMSVSITPTRCPRRPAPRPGWPWCWICRFRPERSGWKRWLPSNSALAVRATRGSERVDCEYAPHPGSSRAFRGSGRPPRRKLGRPRPADSRSCVYRLERTARVAYQSGPRPVLGINCRATVLAEH